MSWDQYIDNLVEACRDVHGVTHCDQACIIGLDGGGAWTTSAHPRALKMSPHEASQVAGCMQRRDFAPFQEKGVVVGGERYLFLRSQDGKVVYAKKKSSGGLTLHSTKSAIIIAHCEEGKQQGHVNMGTGKMADYLESANM